MFTLLNNQDQIIELVIAIAYESEKLCYPIIENFGKGVWKKFQV